MIFKKTTLLLFAFWAFPALLIAQSAMTNVKARNTTSLNGEWQAIIDPAGVGDWRQLWLERKPEKKTDFVEYSFEGGPALQVPGDFNSQRCDLTYFEGSVWYKKAFRHTIRPNKRVFIHFGAVNYQADVYLNGHQLGTHEGGFTPFQFEITDHVVNGENALIVKTNNQRREDGIPGLGFDWFNYGGITRDVHLIETQATFIENYFIQLGKATNNEVSGWIRLNGNIPSQVIHLIIPELHVDYRTVSDDQGLAEVRFVSQPQLWSPENPKLYEVIVQCETDTVVEKIGFRNIEVVENQVRLNGDPVYLKSVNIHEEDPFKAARACTREDALLLLNWAKELGCNMVRLAHYPHNEYMVKLADSMGLMVWSELPIYQHIAFSQPGVDAKMELMMKEMVSRDQNRCSVIVWGLSNETYSFTSDRNRALARLTRQCRNLDSTRLVSHVMNSQGYEQNTFNVWDTLYRYSDIIALNEYIGWYVPWQGNPTEVMWKLVEDKPVFISEFGGEALYGSDFGPGDEAASWSETYQAQIYKDQVQMFAKVPNLCGVCPWLLVDYRSPGRMHPVYQNGYNRKGLISENGQKKKAWYVMKQYYEQSQK